MPETFKLLNHCLSETSPFRGLLNYASQESLFSLIQLGC